MNSVLHVPSFTRTNHILWHRASFVIIERSEHLGKAVEYRFQPPVVGLL